MVSQLQVIINSRFLIDVVLMYLFFPVKCKYFQVEVLVMPFLKVLQKVKFKRHQE